MQNTCEILLLVEEFDEYAESTLNATISLPFLLPHFLLSDPLKRPYQMATRSAVLPDPDNQM